jgi:diguanylate cyclase (GGDEF)-like protein
VIDDSRAALRQTRRALEGVNADFRVLTASDGLQAYKTLLSEPVDLVLCDLVMAGLGGHQFLRLKSSRAELSEIPVIMLSGAEAIEEKVRTLDAGAADYLTKPFDSAELMARVQVHLRIRALQEELRIKNEKLHLLASTDELTGLANRREFMKVGETELSRARRYGHPLSLVLLDLDHFKRVNDTFGHVAGDAVLKAVGLHLLSGLRDHDLAARYGGEEMVLLLPHTRLQDAILVAERYRKNLRELNLKFKGVQVPVSASFGVASNHNKDSTLQMILEEADRALYTAKEHGRDRVCGAEDVAA